MNKTFAKFEAENKSLVENDYKLRELVKKASKSNEDLEQSSENLKRQIEQLELDHLDRLKKKDEEINKMNIANEVKFT